ncbi:General stress protein [Flavobacterium sp. 9AF]|uniref:pyridoxamine 5'-phosphate oxidase family protein n=1 Tax=Flavobacterium sp. 9AF TaxID=2653142 RepID=UPI0012F37996|nr:pyridoxamine 5'-phosphate oxidase family protein [Flavobacterium sp. 9AF]VXB56594.1 General stress protein [Flavobacterium sp. 9AF]
MSKENLFSKDAIEKLKELSEKARTCMFVTNLDKQPPFNSRPMSLQECDNEGNLWFISSKESNKNMEIERNNDVQLYFMNNGDYEYLSILGNAFIYDDKDTIDDKWSLFANAWFDGKEDPNVSIIRVEPRDVYYWDTKAGKFVSMMYFVSSILMGKKTDNKDGVEGKIHI